MSTSTLSLLAPRAGGLNDRDFGLNIIVVNEFLHDDILMHEIRQWRVGINNVAKGVQTKRLNM